MHPLLLACTEEYTGPWVPTKRLKGIVHAEGMEPGIDIAHVQQRALHSDAWIEFTIVDNGEYPFTPLMDGLVRIKRIRTSGKEINIWVQ